MYARDGGAVPEQVLNMRWDYLTPDNPAPEEVAQENNGKALADLLDADGKVLVKKASAQLVRAAARRRHHRQRLLDLAGSWTPAGNQMARRDNADPSGLGNTLGWARAWPLNRRILYNRASADPQGKPWDPETPAAGVGRRQVGRGRYLGLQHRRAGQRRRAVHHAAGRHGPPVRHR